MPSKVVKTFNCVVGRGRVVTLPTDFNVKEGDKMVACLTDTGNLYLTKKRDDKVKLYAAVIGQHLGNGRWYGIIIAETGHVIARDSSSTRDFLIQDLTSMHSKLENKINQKCGDNWFRPEYIADDFLPLPVYSRVQELRKAMAYDEWPPMN